MNEYFHHLISSSEVKSKKPAEEMYHHVIAKYKVKPENSIFIDDKEKNVETAKKLGFNCIVFTNCNQLKDELKTYEVRF